MAFKIVANLEKKKDYCRKLNQNGLTNASNAQTFFPIFACVLQRNNQKKLLNSAPYLCLFTQLLGSLLSGFENAS